MSFRYGISLEATPTVALEKRLSPPKKSSRRDFLSTLGRGILATASGITACGGDGVVDPPDGNTPLDAVIDGDSIVRINHWGGYARAQFDSLGSSPGTASWHSQRDSGGFGSGTLSNLGLGTSVIHDFTIPGTHTVRLEVNEGTSTGTAEHKVHVQQAEKPDTDYPLIAFLHRNNESDTGSSDRYELCLMQADDQSAMTKMVRSNFTSYRLSWEPGGRRIAYARLADNHTSLFMYDFETGEETQIAPGGSSNTQKRPSWSRSGRIAYLDTTRAEEYVELTLINPDGSDQIYLAGSSPSQEFMGFYPSWAPDSEMIALGGAYYRASHVNIDQFVNRVRIFELSGQSVSSWNLNTEDDIIRFISEHYSGHEDEYHDYFAEGVNGTAWSPDGQWITWISRFDLRFQNMALMKRRADGTGPIELLDTAHYQQGSEIIDPCWSPDSKYILYSKGNSPISAGPKWSNLIMRAADGSGEVIQLTDDQNRNEAATWAG